MNNKSHYTEKGLSAYAGIYKCSWPFISLSLYEDHLELSMWPMKYMIKYADIDSVGLEGWQLIGGKIIRIRHHSPGVPAYIGYMSSDRDLLMRHFRELQLKVTT